MPNVAGVVKFLLFVAVVLLIGTGIYAMSLKEENQKLQSSVATMTSERDALKTQVDGLTKESVDAATKVKEAQAQVADLQAKLEAAAKTTTPQRTRSR